MTFLKKIIFTVFLISLYIPLESYHTALKHFAHTGNNLNLAEVKKHITKLDSEEHKQFLNLAVKRILHKYRLIEPVHKELENREGVGLKPYKTALISVVPSRFLDDKPWPGSIDGSRYSSFPHLVNKIAFNHTTNMSGYPISLEFFWHGSYIIALISVILSIFLMIAFYRIAILLGDRLVILPLLTVFPGDYNYFVTGIIQLAQMFSYAYLPGFFILFLMLFKKNLLNKRFNKAPS